MTMMKKPIKIESTRGKKITFMEREPQIITMEIDTPNTWGGFYKSTIKMHMKDLMGLMNVIDRQRWKKHYDHDLPAKDLKADKAHCLKCNGTGKRGRGNCRACSGTGWAALGGSPYYAVHAEQLPGFAPGTYDATVTHVEKAVTKISLKAALSIEYKITLGNLSQRYRMYITLEDAPWGLGRLADFCAACGVEKGAIDLSDDLSIYRHLVDKTFNLKRMSENP